MNRGAHSNHLPLLSGLKPSTSYHFRVQGVAADGQVFVGETQTFRTVAAPTGDRMNLASLAAGAQVTEVSSN
jgi:phosphodiesterase/alkaline phosphatase D-like protein